MTRRIVLICCTLAATGAAAHADTKATARAVRGHLDSAKKHFDLQEYAQAEADLKAAYLLSPEPPILYGIAQAQRMNNDCEHAIISYQSFLRTTPAATQAKLAQDNITQCEEREAARKAEAEMARKAEAEAKARARAAAEDPRRVAGAPEPTRPPPSLPRANWPGRLLVGGGGLVAVAGGLVALTAQRRIEAVADARFYDDFVARSKDAASAKTLRTVGFATLGAGVAFALAGIVAFATHDSGEHGPIVAVGARGELGVAWAW